MKRLLVAFTVMGTALVLASGVAWAANRIDCPNRSDGVSCIGTLGNDDMYGSAEHDEMNGRMGNDLMLGRSGADDMTGGAGRDDMNGQPGADTMNGGTEEDKIDGRAGNDEINAASDRDSDGVTCGRGEADSARVSSVDFIDGERVRHTPEALLQGAGGCETVNLVIFQ